jgi:hypothetical protein
VAIPVDDNFHSFFCFLLFASCFSVLFTFIMYHSVTPSTRTRHGSGYVGPFEWAETFESSFVFFGFSFAFSFLFFSFHIHFICHKQNDIEILVWFSSARSMRWHHSRGATSCIVVLLFVFVLALNVCSI